MQYVRLAKQATDEEINRFLNDCKSALRDELLNYFTTRYNMERDHFFPLYATQGRSDDGTPYINFGYQIATSSETLQPLMFYIEIKCTLPDDETVAYKINFFGNCKQKVLYDRIYLPDIEIDDVEKGTTTRRNCVHDLANHIITSVERYYKDVIWLARLLQEESMLRLSFTITRALTQHTDIAEKIVAKWLRSVFGSPVTIKRIAANFTKNPHIAVDADVGTGTQRALSVTTLLFTKYPLYVHFSRSKSGATNISVILRVALFQALVGVKETTQEGTQERIINLPLDDNWVEIRAPVSKIFDAEFAKEVHNAVARLLSNLHLPTNIESNLY